MSETPETDAEYKEANDYNPSTFVEPLAKFLAVKREMDAAREELALVRKQLVASNRGAQTNATVTKKLLSRLADAERERDEARRLASVWEKLALREASINGAKICAKEEVK